MLNKEVCIRCQNREAPDLHIAPWGWPDEERWMDGKVTCPVRHRGNGILKHAYIEDGIPSHCLCKFEHAVAEGMKQGRRKRYSTGK